MSLSSYKLGEIEVIEQNSLHHNSLIGPHFLNRKKELLDGLKKDVQLSQFMQMREQEGFSDPFQHGIARYVAWKIESFDDTKIKAVLTGKDLWYETPLAAIEGQQFKLYFEAELLPQGLRLKLASVGDSDTIIGIDYHYALQDGKGTISSDVSPQYYDKGDFLRDHPTDLHLDLNQAIDYVFFPSKNPLNGSILLTTSNYQLETIYQCINQENCWQLYKPEQSSCVSIRPLSAQNPWRPNLTVNSIDIFLSIKETVSS